MDTDNREISLRLSPGLFSAHLSALPSVCPFVNPEADEPVHLWIRDLMQRDNPILHEGHMVHRAACHELWLGREEGEGVVVSLGQEEEERRGETNLEDGNPQSCDCPPPSCRHELLRTLDWKDARAEDLRTLTCPLRLTSPSLCTPHCLLSPWLLLR
ncbi:hypothetical protein RRG08_031815 [Elysia crispata]|uniref:Uncharacterized protein n=1 Tax=Elysia crispata TaxID=231223 RepID=A0AAE0Y5K0_9GAST|nr:hypothetical protein RRG08_031815 [Elysia crispata]